MGGAVESICQFFNSLLGSGANVGNNLLSEWSFTDGGSGSIVLTLLPEAYGLISFDASVGTHSEVNPVPVPAAVWLFGSGLLALFGTTRRRKSLAA
ncbi:MAG: PEP-CTERM sorting domain-containing protein [Candidatus Thiodiazotropha sp.]